MSVSADEKRDDDENESRAEREFAASAHQQHLLLPECTSLLERASACIAVDSRFRASPLLSPLLLSVSNRKENPVSSFALKKK